MDIKQRLRRSIVRQAQKPTGPAGHVEGWIFGRRSSNVRRNRWAVELLEVQPTDRVIELGCGPGVAVAALAERATEGLVVGIDHSEVMIGQARHRNADAIRQGRLRLIHAPVERLQVTDGPFDAALAVNTVGMWARAHRTVARDRPAVATRWPNRAGLPTALPRRHSSDVGCGGRPAGRPAVRSRLRGHPRRNARPRPTGGVRARHPVGA
jgi:SAM-dependent methyltransferase